jgi:hypothetical protein
LLFHLKYLFLRETPPTLLLPLFQNIRCFRFVK